MGDVVTGPVAVAVTTSAHQPHPLKGESARSRRHHPWPAAVTAVAVPTPSHRRGLRFCSPEEILMSPHSLTPETHPPEPRPSTSAQRPSRAGRMSYLRRLSLRDHQLPARLAERHLLPAVPLTTALLPSQRPARLRLAVPRRMATMPRPVDVTTGTGQHPYTVDTLSISVAIHGWRPCRSVAWGRCGGRCRSGHRDRPPKRGTGAAHRRFAVRIPPLPKTLRGRSCGGGAHA